VSISQQALILIRLDARRGEVVSVLELASYLQLPSETVCQRILELWHQGYAVPVQESLGGVDQVVGAYANQALPQCH